MTGNQRGPLRILLVLDGLWVGGTERSMAEMLPHLVQAGAEPIIACFRRRPDEGLEAEVLSRGYQVRFLPNAGLLSQVMALRRLIKTEHPHLVHSALFRANLVARLACAGLPVKLLSNLPTRNMAVKEPRNVAAVAHVNASR